MAVAVVIVIVARVVFAATAAGAIYRRSKKLDLSEN